MPDKAGAIQLGSALQKQKAAHLPNRHLNLFPTKGHTIFINCLNPSSHQFRFVFLRIDLLQSRLRQLFQLLLAAILLRFQLDQDAWKSLFPGLQLKSPLKAETCRSVIFQDEAAHFWYKRFLQIIHTLSIPVKKNNFNHHLELFPNNIKEAFANIVVEKAKTICYPIIDMV